jgi:drug/metabolite transporter (DMT)-like permease
VTRRPRLGYALVVTAAVLFIVNAGVSRVSMRAGVDSVTLTTVRVTGSLVVFALWAALARRGALLPPRGRALALVIALGLVGVALLQWTYFVAIDRLPLGVALLLEYTAPVLVALWARFVRREPVRDRVWVALALSLTGLAVVSQVWDGLVLDGVGVAAGFGAAVAFAAYFLLGEHGVSDDDPLRVILWSFVAATVALNLVRPVTALGTDVTALTTPLLGELSGISAPVWLLLGWVVLLGTVVPFFLELLALQHLPATAVVMVAMLEPVGATVLGWVWFGESLTLVQTVGAVAVVTGILLAQTARPTVAREPLPLG